MSADWYPGIQAFCSHWRHAPMLQQTLDTLEREFADDSDASIDAAKALVECACRLLVEELDDPAAPLKPARIRYSARRASGARHAIIAGVEHRAHFFVMTLPHSDACFAAAYPAPDTPFRRGLMRPLRSGQRVADIAKISYAGFGGTAKPALARHRRPRYQSNDYSVPVAYGHQEVWIRGYVHEVVIGCSTEIIARPVTWLVPPIYSIRRRNLGILHHHRIPFPACIRSSKSSRTARRSTQKSLPCDSR